MADDLLAALRSHFGFAAFRPGQAEALASLLAGKHTLAVMPTGAGKSLIYQLAALRLPGLTLVLSPLIALMVDQVDGLQRRHIPATYINSALPADEQARRLQALAAGAYRLAYVAPERLRSVAFQEALRQVRVGLLAVDEAHCISQWGHDFRPDYLHIAAARPPLGEPLTAALTATATPQVQDDIVRLLALGAATRIVTGFNRPNLTFAVRYTPGLPEKLQALRELLGGLDEGAALVYAGTRRDTEEVAEFVRAVIGLEAEHYHGGMSAEARAQVQDAFLAGDLPVVVATNAFGMGIDRPDVRLVVHYALPGSLEAYYQEAGRAGRDGEAAQAVLLYAPRDRALQEWFIENGAPTPAELRALHDTLRAARRPTVWLTADDLSLATGLSTVKVRVGLSQLESAGVVEHLGDEGLRMLLRLGAWDGAAVDAAAASVEERRRCRRAQLAQMIAYAEANACRRRILLDHFGDRSPAQAAYCCDNCLARRPQPAPARTADVASLSHAERAALIILDALRRLQWGVGRVLLAQVLQGSRAGRMQRFGYDQSPYYGRLAIFKRREIEGLILQLIRQGYLKVIGGEQPLLRLTPKGEEALAARAAIPLHLPRTVDPQAVARKQAEREAGGTVGFTRRLTAQGLAPAEIAAERGLSLETIYNHLAQLIGEGALSLSVAVPEAVVAQVRAAIERVGDTAYLAPVKACLPPDISYGQIRCVVSAWRRERGEPAQARGVSRAPSPVQEEEDVAAWLARPHPRPLTGPWQAGWALGFHSRFEGEEWSRSPVGELAYRLKYEGDPAALVPLVEQAMAVARAHPELIAVDALVPVPPSEVRPCDPVSAFAKALGERLGRPVCPVLVKTRRTAPQKEMRTLAQKRANVARAFAVRGDVQGKRVLVLDDLYDSGATLAEVSRILRLAGAAGICVLTLTRTIHAE